MELDWTKPIGLLNINGKWMNKLTISKGNFQHFPRFSHLSHPLDVFPDRGSLVALIVSWIFWSSPDCSASFSDSSAEWMWVLHLGGHVALWLGRGHAQVTCLQFLERNPLQCLESVTIQFFIQLSWVGDWKTKNWLPIVSGFRIGWAFILGSCGCSSHTHSDGPKGINHHWTSSKQASSPSSRPLKAMRPPKKTTPKNVFASSKKKQFYVHQQSSTPPTSSTYGYGSKLGTPIIGWLI